MTRSNHITVISAWIDYRAPVSRPAGFATIATPESSEGTFGRHDERIAVGGHVLSLVCGLAVLLFENRNQWFRADEWDFLSRLGFGHPISLWEPHLEHWSTMLNLIYRALYRVVGVRSYVPYILVLLAFHLAGSHLLWRMMRRVGVDSLIATALTAVFLVFGTGWEALLWAWQIGWGGSLTLGLAFLILVDHDGGFGRRDRVAWLVGVVGLMFSGITVVMIATGGLLVALRRGWRQSLLAVWVPALVYLVWLLLAGREGLGKVPFSASSLLYIADYVWFGLLVVFGGSGLQGASPLLVLVLGSWLVMRSDLHRGRSAAAVAMAIGALILYMSLAASRGANGLESAGSPRYAYIAAALLLPGAGLLLSQLATGNRARHLGVLAVIGFALLHSASALHKTAALTAAAVLTEKKEILSRAQLAAEGATFLNAEPAYPYTPTEALRKMAEDGKLPPGTLSLTDRLAASTALQLAIADQPLQPPMSVPTTVIRVTGATQSPAGAGCISLQPTAAAMEVEVSATRPTSLMLRSTTGGQALATLRSGAVIGPAKAFDVPAYTTVYANVAAAVDALTVRLPASVTEVCGRQR